MSLFCSMKRLVICAVAVLGLSRPATAVELPDRREVLNSAILVNDYFMKKYADYTAPSYVGALRPSNIWTRGTYYEGLLALYRIYPRDDYFRYAYDWGTFHKWNMRNGPTTRNADDHCCGQAYIELYRISPTSPDMLRSIRASMEMLVNTPQVDAWTWVDAIHMAMPVLAKLSRETGESKYLDKMWEMYSYTRNVHGGGGLFNPGDGLWWRDADFRPPYKEPNGEDCYCGQTVSRWQDQSGTGGDDVWIR